MKTKGIAGDAEVARRVRMARGAADMTLGQLAQEVSTILDTPLSREIIRRVELGERDAEVRLLWAIAEVTGEPFDFLVEPLKQAIPGKLNSEPASRSRHQLGDCIGCLIHPDFHVTDDWHYRDPIPGQTEIVIDLNDDKFAIAS